MAALAHLGNCSLRCPTSRHPWRSPALRGIRGSMHVIFESLDVIARLAALVPKPRVNLTCLHGVFAPNSTHRVRVTPARRGKGNKAKAPDEAQDQTPAERRAAMTLEQVRGRRWAQRLKRVFNIAIEMCSECGGAVKVIAGIEDPAVMQKILTPLKEQAPTAVAVRLPESRAPPPVCVQRTGSQVSLFD